MQLAASLMALGLGLALAGQASRSSTPAREAAVPFAVGETLTYDVSFANLLTAGTATTRVLQKRPSYGAVAYEVSAEGRPIPLIQRLYPVFYKMDSLFDASTLLSQWTGLYSEENGRPRQTAMRFDRPARVVRYEMTTPTPAKADVSIATGAQDGLALLYGLRTRAFRSGERFTVPVADDGSTYTVEVETAGRESVSTRFGTVDSWRLNVTILNDMRQQVGQNVALWIGSDTRHLPVKIQAVLPVGSFVLALREAR